MKVFYNCPVCKIRGEVSVPDRAVAVELKFWLEQIVMPRIGEAHHKANSRCNSRTVDLALPVDEKVGRIGKVTDEGAYTDKDIFDKPKTEIE